MCTKEILHHYNEDHNTTSAEVIVPYLLRYIDPQSIIDIGCGLGQWLRVFEQHGVDDVLGIDGAHVPKDMRRFENILEHDLRFFERLRQLLSLLREGKKFDLCLNLEVAEHLPKENAAAFVAFLTDLSDCVLFSAAIPNQTGEHHVNERPHRFWVDLFAQRGYVCCDIFRKEFWNNSSVNWWYRQNMFLFVQQDFTLKQTNFEPYDGNEYIHPILFDMYVSLANEMQEKASCRVENVFLKFVQKCLSLKRL